MEPLHFAYINSRYEIKPYSLLNKKVTDKYIHGFCEQNSRVCTFRIDRILQEFDILEDAEKFINSLSEEFIQELKQKISKQLSDTNNFPRERQEKINKLTFCFTGFKSAQKESLKELAETYNLRVVTDVSPRVDFLVVCETSKTVGPRKLARAKEYNIQVIYEDQFTYMLETGEIPTETRINNE